jgi:hypothetical protein
MMRSNQRKDKVVVIAPDVVHQCHELTMSWPLMIVDEDGTYQYSKFELCSSMWMVSLTVNEDDQLGFSLINLSENFVRASYGVTIRNQISGSGFVWTDPEGIVTFSAKHEGNNEWGTTELISINKLETVEGLIVNKRMVLLVDLYVQDREDLSSHEALVADIERTNDKQELIRLANEDLFEVISHLPQRHNFKAQKKQEDNIVQIRGTK